ncbi:unnamed protein product [Camellia sinensis]
MPPPVLYLNQSDCPLSHTDSSSTPNLTPPHLTALSLTVRRTPPPPLPLPLPPQQITGTKSFTGTLNDLPIRQNFSSFTDLLLSFIPLSFVWVNLWAHGLLMIAFGSSSLFPWIFFLLRRNKINVAAEIRVTPDNMQMIVVQFFLV